MPSIPIIKGVAVSGPDSGKQNNTYQTSSQTEYHNVTADELQSRREDAPKQFQDVIWAVAFIAHLVAIIGIIGVRLASGQEQQEGGGYADAVGSVIFMVGITGSFGIILSIICFTCMMNNSIVLVKAALIFSIFTSLTIGVLGFMMGSILMGILGMVSFLFGLCYAKLVWTRIPFAAANLNTALTAVKANLGITIVSLFFTALAFGWTILWFLGVGGALDGGNGAVIFILFLSYYWVQQVLQNTMHVTTAGVIGTWWFVPAEASSFWSPALSDSVCRATTYSFGSICFGSLLVAIVQALRALEHYSRDNDDFQFLSCIIQCLLGCIEGILESINRWAYVYVGLYGFNYLDAGRNVIQLFENKGWTAIISDDLAENVLFMMSVAVGLASGIVGLLVGLIYSDMFVNLGYANSTLPGFIIGLLSGFVFASVIMSVVGSGVNTVIVCYAEDPAAFQMNHPELSAKMRAAWVDAWPSLMN